MLFDGLCANVALKLHVSLMRNAIPTVKFTIDNPIPTPPLHHHHTHFFVLILQRHRRCRLIFVLAPFVQP